MAGITPLQLLGPLRENAFMGSSIVLGRDRQPTHTQEGEPLNSNQTQQRSIDDSTMVAIAKVSAVLRKLATAASSHFGADCRLHAEFGQALLADLGVHCVIVSGEAAWRIGPGDGDVIAHTPRVAGHVPAGVQGFSYHTWLEHGDVIIDLTTYQLRRKARDLDAADGGQTQVDWCPDFLILDRQNVASYNQVAAAPAGGVAYYERRSAVEALLGEPEVDGGDLATARWLLANPSAMVIGPNTAPALSMGSAL